MDLEERRRLADENVFARFVLTRDRIADPRGGVARFGAVDAVAIGVDAPFFNAVWAVDDATTPDDVVAAIDWVESRGLPVMVRVREGLDPAVSAAVEQAGLVGGPWPMPVMALEPIPPRPPAPPELRIRTGAAELFDDFHAALESGDVIRRIFGRTLVADPDVRLAVGYVDGEPVSSGAAIRSGPTVGLYAVATVEKARRRGIGRAVSWAAIEAGRAAWGSTIATLQSSDVGLHLYRSMGFELIAQHVLYARAEP